MRKPEIQERDITDAADFSVFKNCLSGNSDAMSAGNSEKPLACLFCKCVQRTGRKCFQHRLKLYSVYTHAFHQVFCEPSISGDSVLTVSIAQRKWLSHP